MCLQVINRADNFQPQNVSNTLWAFASTGFHPTGAFLEMVENHLAENIIQEAENYSAQARSCLSSAQVCVITGVHEMLFPGPAVWKAMVKSCGRPPVPLSAGQITP